MSGSKCFVVLGCFIDRLFLKLPLDYAIKKGRAEIVMALFDRKIGSSEDFVSFFFFFAKIFMF